MTGANSHTRDPRFGFRFSITDGVFLVVAGVAAALTWRLPARPGAAVAIVVGHFFLFCNVVRLRRRYELIWAAAFVALSVTLQLVDRLSWGLVLAALTPLTLALVALEVRSPRYHGVLCNRSARGDGPPQRS